MKINKIQKHTLRNSLLSLGIIILALGGFYVYSNFANDSTVNTPDRPANSVNYDEATTDQQQAGIEAKKEALNESSNDTSNDNAANISITSANQNGNTLSIRAIVNSTTPGICKLTLEKANSTSVTQEADTQVTGSYSVCKGFDVSTDSLDKGEWNVKITFTNDSGTANTEKIVTIN